MNAVVSIQHVFGDTLRHWRGHRRLSQLELAMHAEVSQRHLSFLESGRAQPSREMVLKLAEALELPLRETNTLLKAARFAPVFGASALDEADMQPVRTALGLMLAHHEPYPAVVVDACWNLIDANTALHRLFGLVGNMQDMSERIAPGQPPNVLRMTFHPAGLQPHIANFAEIAPLLINRSFRDCHAHPQLAPILEEILDYPGMPSRWKIPDYGLVAPPLLTMDLAAGGQRCKIFTTITTFGTPQDVTTDELRVEMFFPADEASAQLLKALAAST